MRQGRGPARRGGDGSGRAGRPLRRRRAYQAVAEQALAATEALTVSVGRLDPRRCRVHCVGFAAAASAAWRRAVDELALVAPGYRPQRYELPVDVNPACRAVFTRGATVVWPFGRIAEGMSHSQALDVFRDVMGYRVTLHVPLRLGGRVVGAMDFQFPHWPSAGQTAMSQACVSWLEASLQHAARMDQLLARVAALGEAQARATAAEERVRAAVAEMLHGGVQSRLMVAVRSLDEARRAIATDPDAAAAMIAGVVADLDALREIDVRQGSRLLHPAIIGAGLRAALFELAERFAACLRVRLHFTPTAQALDDPLRSGLPADLRLAAYRLVEEALNNAVRHGSASTAEVRVHLTGRKHGTDLVVEVRDDGRGFDPMTAAPGLGLAVLRDRAERLGGGVVVESAPGRGTVVRAHLPLAVSGRRQGG